IRRTRSGVGDDDRRLRRKLHGVANQHEARLRGEQYVAGCAGEPDPALVRREVGQYTTVTTAHREVLVAVPRLDRVQPWIGQLRAGLAQRDQAAVEGEHLAVPGQRRFGPVQLRAVEGRGVLRIGYRLRRPTVPAELAAPAGGDRDREFRFGVAGEEL